eukprot:TRINITY_DN5182_c0_g1_i1.p1 TRINITY_DN5182_c0_g1~~TRINITY_DN5182_c0_g1_i1.p1  ORF type:complete len:644 (-),score=142.18 TRINITY_DN5182_c0_g1_i1:1388-3319(-)
MQHFDPKGHLPSQSTTEHHARLRASLPFDDKRDLDEAARGLIAKPEFQTIMTEAGGIAWDFGRYEAFLSDGDPRSPAYDSIHPSLQRQAMLNEHFGLYEVVPNAIFQVRGFDLANMSIVRGTTGWIVLDCLTTMETARAALHFVNEKLGQRPVTAVIFSHSHSDHFGGVHGVVSEEDVRSGHVPLIAPAGFEEHAVSENCFAGVAMARRAVYQYGCILPSDPFGHVDQSIGKRLAAGTMGLSRPTRSISKDTEELTIDGVRIIFQNTPGTEAPAEMNAYFPDFKAFFAAENIVGTIHNIYTLRGALIRDALEWSKKISQALYLFGQEAEVMFLAHNWPRWGNTRIQEVMRTQRDTYAHLHNDVMHKANLGVTINEIHNVYKLPKSLQRQWAAHSYHGSEEINSRAVINRFLGFWDGNPATLIPLSPADSAPLFVEMMGGEKKIMTKAKELHVQGRYLLAVEILNKLVYAEPKNQEAKDLLADVYEQIGYQQESTSVRYCFLCAALELRNGLKTVPLVTTSLNVISTELWLNYLGIKLDSDMVEGEHLLINLVLPDNDEQFVLELNNSALTNIKNFQDKNAQTTITVNRSDLEPVMDGKVKFGTLVEQGKVKVAGDPRPLAFLQEICVPIMCVPDFELAPGTKV